MVWSTIVGLVTDCNDELFYGPPKKEIKEKSVITYIMKSIFRCIQSYDSCQSELPIIVNQSQ